MAQKFGVDQFAAQHVQRLGAGAAGGDGEVQVGGRLDHVLCAVLLLTLLLGLRFRLRRGLDEGVQGVCGHQGGGVEPFDVDELGRLVMQTLRRSHCALGSGVNLRGEQGVQLLSGRGQFGGELAESSNIRCGRGLGRGARGGSLEMCDRVGDGLCPGIQIAAQFAQRALHTGTGFLVEAALLAEHGRLFPPCRFPLVEQALECGLPGGHGGECGGHRVHGHIDRIFGQRGPFLRGQRGHGAGGPARGAGVCDKSGLLVGGGALVGVLAFCERRAVRFDPGPAPMHISL
ncbi:hypothetical protein ACFZDM_33235 [Streptomyces californicus]|uniref:hypothetical protein n=1 Tax=Streptomyces californicus TaxID=67351 RepID=UPI0036EF8053